VRQTLLVPSTTIAPGRRRLVYGVGGIGLGTNALVLFLVPLRAHELGMSLAAIGVLLGVKSIVEAVLSVPVGAFIGRVGARQGLIIGSFGVALSGAAFLVTSSALWLFAIQVLLGVLRPMAWIGGQMYAAGMRSKEFHGRDTARFSFGANVGQMVTPLGAGLLVEYSGTRAAFVGMTVYGLVFMLVSLLMPDIARSAGKKGGDRTGFVAALRLLRLPSIRVDLLLTFVRLWLPTTWSSFLPVYLVSVGTSAVVAGSVSTSMALVSTLVSLLAGWVVKLGTPTVMTTLVLGISAVGVVVTPLLTDVPWVYLSAVLVGIGQGLSLPLLLVMVNQSAPPDLRALALGLRASVNQAGATLSPVITGALIAVSSLGVGFAVSGALAGAIVLGAGMLHRHNARTGTHDGDEPEEPGPAPDPSGPSPRTSAG